MDEFLTVGRIVKPQGVRGEVKVAPFTDDPERFLNLKSVIVDGKSFKILSARVNGEAVFLALSGISDRNAAELLRNKDLKVLRSEQDSLAENVFYIVDVLGCSLYSGGALVGEIVDVFQSRVDVFTVKCTDGRTVRFPFLKDLLVCADVENKRIDVDAKRFNEVSCYEN